MTDPAYDVAEALAAAADDMDRPTSIKDTLDAVVAAAKYSVPGFDEVSVTVASRDQRTETRAGTGELAWQLDALQYELDEGPCLDAARGKGLAVAHADDLGQGSQWPRYAPQARDAGIRCQLAVPLRAADRVLGGLNLYSTSQDSVDEEAVHVAGLFARHAALALARVSRETQLSEALESRTLIGTATGLVMARYGLTEQRAFQFLVRASSTSNIKLRKIAEEIVWTADAEHGGTSDGQ
ncbi:GAF and ANTAR domain-containing protein [Nocardioides sp. zg-ZUI104]|uniref:GAF and ANTAR domain-containing protein n=1 Tax=Nocardioides faecalis TaxID=2803858 RepID=UPI001BCDB0E4|nr:GAF and ANTAR domain-containing protein [Nocardioides faecalis]MBS4751816.1 GAF and ANTAR domain-containing protein [Nocardioides faecalis]